MSANKYTVNCETCDKELGREEVEAWTADDEFFCSADCHDRWEKGVELECEDCGVTYLRLPTEDIIYYCPGCGGNVEPNPDVGNVGEEGHWTEQEKRLKQAQQDPEDVIEQLAE